MTELEYSVTAAGKALLATAEGRVAKELPTARWTRLLGKQWGLAVEAGLGSP